MRLTPEILDQLRFVEGTKAVFPTFEYALGRNRYLTVTLPGTSNEMLSLVDRVDMAVVILHNWDYDGPLTLEKINALIWCLTKSIPKDEGVQV